MQKLSKNHILLCFSPLDLFAQIEVDWVKTDFDYIDIEDIFTAGHTKGQELLRSDTVVISKLAANGELLYTNFLILDLASLPRVLKMDINEDGTELLLSGMILKRDDFLSQNSSKAYIARINAEDGSLIQLSTFYARELGGSLGAVVELPMAQYDVDGNILLTAVVIDGPMNKIDIKAVRMDLDGNILDRTNILSNLNGFPFPFTYRFNQIGGIPYLSGSYRRVDGGEGKEAFVAKLGTGEVIANTSENITVPIPKHTHTLELIGITYKMAVTF